jgi:hypothetical protein
MSNASLPYLMGRNLGSIRGVLGSFRGVEVGEGIIVNHREVPLLLARAGSGSVPNWMVRAGGNGNFSGLLERAKAQAGAGAIVLWRRTSMLFRLKNQVAGSLQSRRPRSIVFRRGHHRQTPRDSLHRAQGLTR